MDGWTERQAVADMIGGKAGLQGVHRELTGITRYLDLADPKTAHLVQHVVNWAKLQDADAWLAVAEQSYRAYLSPPENGKPHRRRVEGFPLVWWAEHPDEALVQADKPRDEAHEAVLRLKREAKERERRGTTG